MTDGISEFMNNALEINQESNQKTFSDLPIKILGRIAEKLDFKSQMTLRNVSRGLRDIVDQTKPSIFQIWCFFHENYNFSTRTNDQKVARILICQRSYHRHNCSRFYTGEDFLERALNDLKVILSNPRLQLNYFHWRNELSPELDEKLIEILKSLNHKIETLYMDTRVHEKLMIDLLKAVKPGILKEINCGGKYDSNSINRLAQLNHWKKAKNVAFYEIIPDLASCLHHFQHFEEVEIAVESVSIDLVEKMFTQNNKLKHLHIDTEDSPSELATMKKLGLIDIRFNREKQCFSGKYEIPELDEHLEVTINDYEIEFDRKTEESD